ncbi:hypothetical protein SE_0158 [Staphylococcus epidermidis ATCC 12228]|uniref:Uncharacterized protein n=1 Tax=Staphylococcus epidermidis (strain ATCC 12228 / FDA PCI 1200) TaxID=176280 RepID=A0A0H2VGV9_STAES|nr:hypothetical protein SE_0158 [Staphylococcus epidermidis ATCC 12228]
MAIYNKTNSHSFVQLKYSTINFIKNELEFHLLK